MSCATCGTFPQHEHATWCDRHPDAKQYPDRDRFVTPYLEGRKP